MISIAMRLRPFSLRPGTICLIPKTEWQVQVFPTLLRFTNLVTFQTFEQRLDLQGPVLDFGVELDLEKCLVRLYGNRKKIEISAKDLPIEPKPFEVGKERLSLGLHKKLDWDLVKRRLDFCEIFPIWFRLGQLVPYVETPKVGTAALLRPCDKMEVITHYRKLFLAGFHGIMAPRLSDDDHQGIIPEGNFSFSPLGLLYEGSKLIRSLFFSESGNIFSFLPQLPPEFHAGRMIFLQTFFGDEIDLEWSKKLLKRAVIRPKVSREVYLDLQKSIRSFRIGKKKWISADKPLALEAGKILYLDRFEK